MSRPSFCEQIPAVLEQLVEHLGRLELALQLAGDRPHDRLEDACASHSWATISSSASLAGCTAAVGVEVVEQAPGLVLPGVEPGEPQQPTLVVAGVDDLRLDAHRACPLRPCVIASSSMSKPRSFSRLTRSLMRQRSAVANDSGPVSSLHRLR